jgi:hypothetical protein
MPLPLQDEPCLVLFQFEYFYDHAPMVGELKTINVWVDQGQAGRGRWCIVQVISWNLNFSGRNIQN